MRPANRHGKKSFFKYLTPSTAKTVLTNGTLRYSAPTLFNDPFDVPLELAHGITAQDIIHAGGRHLSALIEKPPADTSCFKPEIGLVLEAVKAGFLTPEVKADMLAAITNTAATHQPPGSSFEELRAMWRSWIPDMRILCLSEEPLNAALWNHYCEAHTGATLELNCDDPQSPWQEARAMTYSQEKPCVYSADGWARLLMLNPTSAFYEMLDTATLTKTQDWAYEREWRVVSMKKKHEQGDFSDYRFLPEELSSIYLGAKMTDPDRALLLSIATEKYPRAHIFELKPGLNREFIVTQIRG